MDDRASRARVTGPLAPHADGFGAWLAGRGYAPSSAAAQLHLMAHLSRWLADEGLTAGDLAPAVLDRFLAARKTAGYRRLLSARATGPLAEYVARAGLVVTAGPAAQDGVLAGYQRHLVTERGLAAPTIRNYLAVAAMLAKAAGPDLETLTAGSVRRFVLDQCRGSRSASVVVTGLRSFLRYLHLAGITPVPLAGSVTAVASASPLPEAVSPAGASLLLGSCDRETPSGLRDYAVLVLLSRLGLRAGEVAAMQLADIGWRAGQVTVRGKGARVEELPLPADAGAAIAGWLRGGRPDCPSRHVFITMTAPVRPVSRKTVLAIVKRAAARAGLDAVTAHRLRHGAATGLLRAGAGLPEVGQVLRHASMLNTARYARVDHGALTAVARPWPGAGQ